MELSLIGIWLEGETGWEWWEGEDAIELAVCLIILTFLF